MATATAKATQTVVGSVILVPENFVPMASFGTRRNGKAGTRQYEIVLAAYTRGEIDAYKVMVNPRHKTGPVFVDATQAAALIEADSGTAKHHEPARPVHSERIESATDAVRMLHEQIGRLLVQAMRLELEERNR